MPNFGDSVMEVKGWDQMAMWDREETARSHETVVRVHCRQEHWSMVGPDHWAKAAQDCQVMVVPDLSL
jgi:hypothetical protein